RFRRETFELAYTDDSHFGRIRSEAGTGGPTDLNASLIAIKKIGTRAHNKMVDAAWFCCRKLINDLTDVFCPITGGREASFFVRAASLWLGAEQSIGFPQATTNGRSCGTKCHYGGLERDRLQRKQFPVREL